MDLIIEMLFSLFLDRRIFINDVDTFDNQGSLHSFAALADLNFIRGGYFSSPQVSGKYKGFSYTLTTKDERVSNPRTDIFIDLLNVSHLNFCIYSKNLSNKFVNYLRGQKMETGDKKFDEAFVIKGNEFEEIKELLTDEIRSEMLRCNNGINICFEGKRLHYTIDVNLTDPDKLTYISDILWLLTKNISKNKFPSMSQSVSKSSSKTCHSCGEIVLPPNKFCIICGTTLE